MSPAASARYWSTAGDTVVCELCPHLCRLGDGETGACGVRRNEAGALVTEAYALAAAARPSPIERQFLYHVLPGATTYSFAGPGCNLRCLYCQNWLVSQTPKQGGLAVPGLALSPDAVVAAALAAGCDAIACTYSEPGIYFEYAVAVAVAAHQAGLPVVWKSAGYLSPGPLTEALAHLTAINVDLKSFRDETYRSLVGARLAPVLETLRQVRQSGVWLEVTTLVVPGLNDTAAELADIADFIRGELGHETPWHLNRFHPDHRLTDRRPTTRQALLAARDAALARGLHYVYTDAAPTGTGWDTVCPACGEVLVRREQYAWRETRLRHGACPACGHGMPGVGLAATPPA